MQKANELGHAGKGHARLQVRVEGDGRVHVVPNEHDAPVDPHAGLLRAILLRGEVALDQQLGEGQGNGAGAAIQCQSLEQVVHRHDVVELDRSNRLHPEEEVAKRRAHLRRAIVGRVRV